MWLERSRVGGQLWHRDVRERRSNAMIEDIVQQQQDMAPFALHSLVEPASAFLTSGDGILKES
uniref:AlNc14C213G8956 protein n=1 Tax=Albugo laibachii Nc14 TaxID=890382 RepID=F0WRF3_9STRA|nr:AlNc14C213G8956 [Albugo laibachii Nc14]|eukprot:CCA23916.1 AlNc14C213G8956 [Albugo laibachii Nc14]